MVKEITLTNGGVTLVDDADYEYLMQWEWHSHISGVKLYVCQNGKTLYMHQLILNTPKGMESDHRDGDGLNNQRSNLRICTRAENQHNQMLQIRQKSSKFKGVHLDKRWGKWIARIGINGKQQWLGYFNSETDAALAYDEAARKYYGEFAGLNFKEVK